MNLLYWLLIDLLLTSLPLRPTKHISHDQTPRHPLPQSLASSDLDLGNRMKSDGSLQHINLPPEKLLFWVCQSYLLTLISGIFGIQNGHLANGNSVFGTSDSIYVIPWSIDVMGLKPPKPRTPKVWGKQSFQLYHEGWPRIEWSALRTVRTKHCFWWFLIPTRMIDVRGNETDTYTSHGNLFGWNVIIPLGIRPSERIIVARKVQKTTVDMLFFWKMQPKSSQQSAVPSTRIKCLMWRTHRPLHTPVTSANGQAAKGGPGAVGKWDILHFGKDISKRKWMDDRHVESCW